jgi:hypothetical protein
MSQLKKKSNKNPSIIEKTRQDSSVAGRTASTSVNLEESDGETEGSSAKRRFTTANQVSPHLSNRSKRARETIDDEFMQDLLDDRLGETEDDLLYPFPFRAMRMFNRSDSYNPAGKDPRGPKFDDGGDLPDGHCDSCKCLLNLCHDTRFGLYCGLRVAEMIKEKGAGNIVGASVSGLLKKAYNEVLRVETVQHIGVLDTYNDYDPPECILNKSMKNIMRHFLYEKYSTKMKERLENGSLGRWGTGSHGFYAALHHEVEIEMASNREQEECGEV